MECSAARSRDTGPSWPSTLGYENSQKAVVVVNDGGGVSTTTPPVRNQPLGQGDPEPGIIIDCDKKSPSANPQLAAADHGTRSS